jgi:hypothetical protein
LSSKTRRIEKGVQIYFRCTVLEDLGASVSGNAYVDEFYGLDDHELIALAFSAPRESGDGISESRITALHTASNGAGSGKLTCL